MSNSVYVVTIPAMRNEALKCLRGDQVAILYWRIPEEVQDFLVRWNIPGEVTQVPFDYFSEVCQEEGYVPVELDLGPNEVFELKYEYLEKDTEYYRAFLEESFENTKDSLVEDRVSPSLSSPTVIEKAFDKILRVVASIYIGWGLIHCLLVIGVKALGYK
jgi:hypothetical protein